MISASTANMADVEHVYIWYFSLSLVCRWWWWWLHSICEYCMCCVVFGWHNAWLALFSLALLSLTVCLWSWLCFNCIVYEVDERTKRTDEGCWCSTDKNVTLWGRGGLLRRYAMLCYTHRLRRTYHVWVSVRACGCGCVYVQHTLNSHEAETRHTLDFISLNRNPCTVWIVNVWPLRGRFSSSSAFARDLSFYGPLAIYGIGRESTTCWPNMGYATDSLHVFFFCTSESA